MKKHARGNPKQTMRILALLLCLGILLFSVWLLFVPNRMNRAKTQAVSGDAESSVSSSDDSGGAAVAAEAQAFVAVLEGETAQISAGDWESTDTAIATVDDDGVISGIAQGSCQITDGTTTYQVAVRHLEQRENGTYVDGILIVNKSYPLSADYDPGLQPVTEEAFTALSDAAAEEGLDIYIGSDYRDYAYQVEIYNNYCDLYGWEQADTFSARPGYSEHQTGLTIDCNTINDAFSETAEAAWLAQHCAEYGFIIRFPEGKEDITGYQYESWHIRYVGAEIAREIQKYNLTLEEYLGVKSEYAEDWTG